jgi:hypothetical protein
MPRESCPIEWARLCWSHSNTVLPIPCPRREVDQLPCRARIRLRRLAALTGHHIPAQGANPGNAPHHSRVLKERRLFSVSRISAPALLYAVFLQNTPILSDAVPRVGTLGWYALPPSGQFAVPRAMPSLVCGAPLGQIEQWHFDPAFMPKRGASRSDVSARLRWSQSRHHVFVPMPQRGIAYQPRVPTLGITRKKKPAF